MAVPRNRVSNRRKNMRRSHCAKKASNFRSCSNCKEPTLPHRMCPSCGYYDNQPVVQAEAPKQQ